MPTAWIIGNSDGIGLALTELLLAEGYRVVGISRSPGRITDTTRYEHHVVDVCDALYPDLLAKLVEHAEPDVCVYSAAIGEFVDTSSLVGERRVFETNLIGAVATAQAVLPVMARRGHGHFIGLSSQADRMIDGHAPSYAASKAGLSCYLEGLALAYRPRNVFVTNLRLGFVDTKLAKAEVRPFMLTVEQAAQRIRHCMRTRPARDTFPKRMAILLCAVRWVGWIRRWVS